MGNNPIGFVDWMRLNRGVPFRANGIIRNDPMISWQINHYVNQIREINPNYRFQTIRPVGSSFGQRDVEILRRDLINHQLQQQCGNNQKRPNLNFAHPPSTLENGSGYSYWRNQSLNSIIDSLRPNRSNEEPLIVNPRTGVIMQGNTRTYILQQNGININLLPRGE